LTDGKRETDAIDFISCMMMLIRRTDNKSLNNKFAALSINKYVNRLAIAVL